MFRRICGLLAASVVVGGAGVALATSSLSMTAAADLSAMSLAMDIQQRALKSSFADLDRFAEAAERQPGREGLRDRKSVV